VFRAADTLFYEGQIRLEAFRATKADALSIYLRCYNYVATASRYGGAISLLTGAGLATPTF
jgi:hypothetical protein